MDVRILSDGNAFPSTDRSRLAEMLARDSGARKKAVSEVLVRYADPLRVYVAGSSLRANGDPADFVRGFLASRLGREAYLDDWIDSGLQLRRWLINGLHLFEKEEFRRSRPAAMAEMSRRVSNLLREHLRLLLVRDGVKPEDVGAELRAMLQALQEHARD